MTTFTKGDKVAFTDKFGIRQVGSYEGPAEPPMTHVLPKTYVVKMEWSVVIAKVFADLGDDSDIRCLVPTDALIKEAT